MKKNKRWLKKIKVIAAIAILCLSNNIYVLQAHAETKYCGDINQDGNINLKDVTQLKRLLSVDDTSASTDVKTMCTFRINGAPFPRQRCKRLAPAVRYPFVVTC